MLLTDILHLGHGMRMGLWHITETPGELLAAYQHLQQLPMPFTNIVRQQEFLAVRALLFEMTGSTALTIDYLPSGKPVVEGWHVSLSHTRGYAVLLLSDRWDVGVDIEQRSRRVERIASRFIRPDEVAVTTDEKLLLWSAKETVYKLFSEENLHFFDMQALPHASGFMPMINKKHGQRVTVHYEFFPDFVLTWASA